MELNEIRNQIDETDAALVELFQKRMKLSGEIAAYKVEHNLPVLQPGREREVLLHVSELAGPEFSNYARVLYATLMDLSRAYQNQFTTRDSEAFSTGRRRRLSRSGGFFFTAGL